MLMLKIRALSFDYPQKKSTDASGRILEDFSLSLSSREVAVMLGPSGCGKSTILALLAGLERMHSGELVFDGLGSAGMRPKVGVVFQSPTLVPWRSTLRNAIFGAEMQGYEMLSRAESEACELLERYGLGDYLQALPSQLSGGMKQRVALIRAIVSRAEMLLLDEPFSNSDFVTKRALQIDLDQLIARRPMLVVLVTHDLDDAVRFGDRIVLIGGRPALVLDDFTIDIPRKERLAMSEGASDLTHYLQRIWRSWSQIGKTGGPE